MSHPRELSICQRVLEGRLPSTDGNTDMRVVGGTQRPGGTAIFEITYPLNASSVGKEFQILACAYIDDVGPLVSEKQRGRKL